MDDDYNVLFITLLNNCLSRCIIDYNCLNKQLINNEGSNVVLRNLLIQFTRVQREIFLKLKVIFDLTKYEKGINKLLQEINTDYFNQNVVQNLNRNLLTLTNQINAPPPNIKLSVDLYNNLRYERMPSMMSEIAKSVNTFPTIKYSDEEINSCIFNIKLHFLIHFQQYKMSYSNKAEPVAEQTESGNGGSPVGEILFINNICNYRRSNYFDVEILFDFKRYQIIHVTVLGQTANSPALMAYLNQVLNTRSGNVFMVLDNAIMNYVNKLILQNLYKQTQAYYSAGHVVFNYDYSEDKLEVHCFKDTPSLLEFSVNENNMPEFKINNTFKEFAYDIDLNYYIKKTLPDS
uniref:Mediator of RNA polymerase II transcription subunit 14 n=1 Tax=Theileria annulata TaxID=5874 RepID=A0A3B0N7L5_THEAN